MLVFNLLLLGLFLWGVVELFTGIFILLYIPVLLLAKLFARPVQLGYTPEQLRKLTQKKPSHDEHGIPYL